MVSGMGAGLVILTPPVWLASGLIRDT